MRQASEGDLGQNEDMRSLFALAFVGGAIVWVLVLGLAPLLPTPVAAITYALGSFMCHQRPERSFHLSVVQLPVCARCIGIYAGAALASLGWALRIDVRLGLTRRPSTLRRSQGRPEPSRGTTGAGRPEALDGREADRQSPPSGHGSLISRRLFVVAAIPTVVTLLVEWMGVWLPSNIVRATAGVPLGFAAALVVIGALTTLHYDECARRPPIGPTPKRTHI